MIIRKMTATFGKLEGAVLEPGEGLTVITAPNESGKSTWAGFLKAMLFGIDTKERDKAGTLADKNRYQPWSGAPLAGEMEVEWEGKGITLRRFPLKSNPFGGFEAVYTATGDPVPGLTAANVGEQITGGGKEVFLRSAFIGEGAVAVTHSGELEGRVAALATSGQEDVSRTETERRLKDWRNRRRSNRTNGLIPDLERELRAVEGALEALRETDARRERAAREEEALLEEIRSVKGDLEIWTRLERHDLNRRYGEVLARQEEVKAAFAAFTPPHPELAELSVAEVRSWAAGKEAAYRDALKAREDVLMAQAALENGARRPARLAVAGVILLAVLAFLLAFLGWREILTFPPSLCLILLVGACGCLYLRNHFILSAFRKAQELEIPEIPEKENWQEKAQAHCDCLTRREGLALELKHLSQRGEDLAAQGAAAFDTLELLHPPIRSRADLERRLAGAERELEVLRSQRARQEGALQQMGDPEGLEARRTQLEEALSTRTGEYDALTLAMDALDRADAALRERFSPALNQTAGEIFSRLTWGRWPGLSLARDFSAKATEEGGLLPRPALALSAGTADQLYLAVRLAVCRLTLPHCPLLLDDALAAFDDERMALALDYLAELGKERQVLLFTCHSRERAWAEQNHIPNISFR